jgi:hypothetical protein
MVGTREGKRLLGRNKRRWENNIGINLRGIGWEDVDYMYLPEDRDHWRFLENTVMILRVS